MGTHAGWVAAFLTVAALGSAAGAQQDRDTPDRSLPGQASKPSTQPRSPPAQTLPFRQTYPIEISGEVVDVQDNPVADAVVCLYREARDQPVSPNKFETIASTQTGTDGSFVLKGGKAEGRFETVFLIATKKGLALDWETIPPVPGRPERFTLRLTEPGKLGGVVMDESGAPIHGAEVNVVLRSEGENFKAIHALPGIGCLSSQTDSAGHFEFSNLPKTAHVAFHVVSRGKATVLTYDFLRIDSWYKAGDEDIEIRMQPEAILEGQVVDAGTGQGVEATTVSVVGGRTAGPAPFLFTSAATTDALGKFAFKGLPAGEYVVRANARLHALKMGRPRAAAERSARVTVAAGETVRDVKVEIGIGTPVQVTVVETDGTPVFQARVACEGGLVSYGGSGFTYQNGSTTLYLLPGEYRLGVQAEGYAQEHSVTTVTVPEGQPQQVRIELPARRKIRGVVRDSNGDPVGGATVHIAPRWRGKVKTGEDGTFIILLDPPNDAREAELAQVQRRLLIRHEERNLAALVDVPEENRPAEVTLSPGVAISCRVTDPSGTPIAGAMINGYLVESFPPVFPVRFFPVRDSTGTDKDGYRKISAIPPGVTLDLTANADGYRAAEQQLRLEKDRKGVVELETFVLYKQTATAPATQKGP